MLRPYLLVLAIAAPLRSAVIDWNLVPSGSMAPTIVPVEMVLVNKLAYGLRLPFSTRFLARWDEPRRGDVVVFFSPADEVRLVKRVIGLPGDVVEMRDERLLLNGTPVDYAPTPDASALRALARSGDRSLVGTELLPGRSHPILIQPEKVAVRSFGPVTVPDGHYFVLGDNRDDSADSRFIGMIEGRRVIGRASAVLASFDFSAWGRPRPGRFLTAIP